MKIINYIAIGVTCIEMLVNVAAVDTTGDRLKIGANHSLNGANTGISAGYGNAVSGNYNIIGGGAFNTNRADWNSVISGGYLNSILKVTTHWTGSESVIGGGQENLIEGARFSTISGGEYNTIGDMYDIGSPQGDISSDQRSPYGMSINGGRANELYGSEYSLIAGGYANVIEPWNNFSVIGGGMSNRITYGSGYSVISGGVSNIITKGAWWATINGGQNNVIEGGLPTANTLWDSTKGHLGFATNDLNHWGWIGGGYSNHVTGRMGSVGGGHFNGVMGKFGTVPGGAWNHADGQYSLAAGRHAHAIHDGSFVWADSTGSGATEDVMSPAANSFSIRASGGIWLGFGTNTPSIPSGRFISTSTGAYLSIGGSWVNSSDKSLKENFKDIDNREVLKGVAALRIREWNYKAEDDRVRHIGPVAQEFYSVFSLGDDEYHISSIDTDGVALASIQALNQIVEEKDERIQALEERLRKIERFFESRD